MPTYEIESDGPGRFRVREVPGCGSWLGFIVLCLVVLGCCISGITKSDPTAGGGDGQPTTPPPPSGVRSTGVPGDVLRWVDIHSKPSLDRSTIIGQVPRYATVTVYCQTAGPSVTQSNGEENSHWDLIRYTAYGNTTDGYVPDALVNTNNIVEWPQIDAC